MRRSLGLLGILVFGALLEVACERSPAGSGSPPAIPATAPNAGLPARAPDPSNPIYRVPVDASASAGPEDALVTLVESSDFECPFCKRAAPVVKQLQEAYPGKLRVVFKHNPLPFHAKARLAAAAVEEARAQGGDPKFWQMHDALFELSPALERPNLEAAAGKIGLDPARFRAALDSSAHEGRIARDQALMTKLGAGATPSFFVNGRLIEGALPIDGFKALLDEELQKAEARVVKAGTAPREVYAAIIENGATIAAPRAPPPPPPPAASKIPVRPDDPVRGPKLGKVTVVLFSDFQCPFCSRLEPDLKRLAEAYPKDLRIVWKHQPLAFHPNARPAAMAAEAAREQGKFWEMHDLMFSAQQELSPARYDEWARKLKLDPKKVKAALSSERLAERIDADVRLANAVGATGTPTMFFNCRMVVGAKPFEELKGIADAELTKASALLARGTKLDAGFYDKACDENVRALVPARPQEPLRAVTLRPDDPVRGKANAQITVVAFSDFQCPFCARANATLDEVLNTYKDRVRLVWKHQPLPNHSEALPAAIAAEAARQQGKFWEFHDKLFANQNALSAESYRRWAGELGLDLGRFDAAIADPRTRLRVVEDAQLGGALGASATPTFFINGERLVGALPVEQFKAVIDRQLNRTARR